MFGKKGKTMTQKLIALRVRVQSAIDGRRDAGQGTLEYVGMIIIASLIVVVVATALDPAGIGTALTTAVTKFTTGKG